MQSGIEGEAKTGLLFPGTLIGGDGMAAAGNAEKAFDRVKAQLKARLGGEVYSSWFGRMKVTEASKGLVRISVPTAFLRSWINSHYLDLISELWKQEDPDVLKIDIVVRTSSPRERAPSIISSAKSRQVPSLRSSVRAGGCVPGSERRV